VQPPFEVTRVPVFVVCMFCALRLSFRFRFVLCGGTYIHDVCAARLLRLPQAPVHGFYVRSDCCLVDFMWRLLVQNTKTTIEK
jgi:hypothetical protein